MRVVSHVLSLVDLKEGMLAFSLSEWSFIAKPTADRLQTTIVSIHLVCTHIAEVLNWRERQTLLSALRALTRSTKAISVR
jgi:hypothetical protein